MFLGNLFFSPLLALLMPLPMIEVSLAEHGDALTTSYGVALVLGSGLALDGFGSIAD